MNEEDLGKSEWELYKEGKISIMECLEISKRNIDPNICYLIDWSKTEEEQLKEIKEGKGITMKQMMDKFNS